MLGKTVSPADVTIASYDFVAREPEAVAGVYDVMILDEVHYLKNPKSKRTKAVFGEKCDRKGGLAEHAQHVFCLSGTPAPNNPSELWPMVRALAPALLDKAHRTFWGFTSRYCRTRDNGFGLQILGGRNLTELRQKLAPFMLRRRKEDVLPDLPPLRLDTLFVDGIATRELSVLSAEYRGRIEQALDEDGLDGLAKLAPHVAQLRRLTGLLKVPGVIEIVDSELLAGGKIVLGAYHRDVIDALADALNHWGVAKLTGSTPADERQYVVDQFQVNPHCRVFIGQLTAAGVGITLTAASETILVESSWVPAENEQFCMRIHRIGQKAACRVRFATLADSLDEKINRAVLRKTQDILTLFN